MDKNGKLFGRLSVFDIAVVIILIVVAAGTFYKFHSKLTNVSGGQKTLAYTVTISGVRDFTLPYFKTGLACFDTKTGEQIGTIVAVSSEPFKDTYADINGVPQTLEVPNEIKITLDIETPGLETDAGFFANGTYELKAGSTVGMTTKYSSVAMFIESVKSK